MLTFSSIFINQTAVMAGVYFPRIFIIESTFLLLVSCDTLSNSPLVLSPSLSSPGPSLFMDPEERTENTSLDPDNNSVPGFIESSQESGFFSEDSEEKQLPLVQLWNESDEVNSTKEDPDALTSYSPASLRPSASSEVNSSLAKSMENNLWEIKGESSGLGEPAERLATADAAPLTQTTTTDPARGLVQQRWGRTKGQSTAVPEDLAPVEGDWTLTRPDVSTQRPTRPEMGALPVREPLQPDDPGEEKVAHHAPLTTVPSSSFSLPPSVAFTEVSWNRVGVVLPEEESELRHGPTESFSEADLHNTKLRQEPQQIICVDWSDLAGKGYVILKMSDNFDCDEFRMESGDRLLEMVETAISRKIHSPQGSWLIFLSKPTRQDRELLMTLASEHDVITTKDVLSILGEIRRGLNEIGIQNYTSATSCHSRPSQTRSDYGKLFVVLVIIGSVCVVIIASGLIYICWQRRLPKMKNPSRGEELHFVENGCHDNPTLDVTADSQSEMQEKNHNANGLTTGGGGGWHVLVNKSGKEETESLEEDTHL